MPCHRARRAAGPALCRQWWRSRRSQHSLQASAARFRSPPRPCAPARAPAAIRESRAEDLACSTPSASRAHEAKAARKMTLILGLESSCDDSAAALVTSDRRVLAQTVVGQSQAHQPYGGVVPEIAARAHVEILPEL